MSIYLKIKAQSLAEESRIIRAQELRLAKRRAKAKARLAAEFKGDKIDALRSSLHLHRVHEVRKESRATHLARGFLKGKAYYTMEQSAWTWPPMARVKELIEKYAPGDTELQVIRQRYAEWFDAAKEVYKLPREIGVPRRKRIRPSNHPEEAEKGK